jgi:hypothetical protein
LLDQSYSSQIFAFFQAVARTQAKVSGRGRKILLWLAVVAAPLGQAPPASARGGTFTTTTLTVSSGSGAAGTATTLTATVITNLRLGQMLFCDATAVHCDGAAVFGTAQMTASGTPPPRLILGVGTCSTRAVFRGFHANPLSPSAAQAVTVTANSSYVRSTRLAAAGPAVDYMLTGTVTSSGRATATGSLSFIDMTDGNAVIGIPALNHGSLATV